VSTFYAVPGSMQPGSIWPGDTLTGGGGGQFAVFTGIETLTYSQYMDVSTQKTLVARPGGGVYDITAASGYPGVGPFPDDGRWIPE
jgi:hypothetical protein